MRLKKQMDVLCIGATLVDIPLYPVSRELFDNESYPLDQIAMTIGGDAVNEATIISRLGKKTALVSMIGKDAVGDFILHHCRENGIDTTGVKQKDGVDTSINIGMVTADGERTFITNRNGSLWKMTLEDVDLSVIKGAKILSFGSIFNNASLDAVALKAIFQKGKEEGMIICTDMIKPRFGEKLADIAEALSYVDYFFPNFDEACLITDETDLYKVADRIMETGVGHVIIKIGTRGCYIRSQDGTEMIVPVLQGVKAVDTIGAGDNFAAGFITGLVEGKSLRECGEYANVTAVISIQSIGATTGVQRREQLDEGLKLYRKQYDDAGDKRA